MFKLSIKIEKNGVFITLASSWLTHLTLSWAFYTQQCFEFTQNSAENKQTKNILCADGLHTETKGKVKHRIVKHRNDTLYHNSSNTKQSISPAQKFNLRWLHGSATAAKKRLSRTVLFLPWIFDLKGMHFKDWRIRKNPAHLFLVWFSYLSSVCKMYSILTSS